MVKVGDTVKWDAGSKGMLGGKVTGGEKGKRWKIEKAGKTYYVLKDKVKKGIVKKSEKKVVKKPPAPKYPKKAKVPQKRSKMFPESTTSSPDKPAPAKKAVAKKATVNKDLLQNVMGVMAEVAKDKGKSTKKEVDSKVALDKKAEKGKLTNKDFKELMFDDNDTSEIIYDFEENLSEGQGYNMDYWRSRVSKRADSWDELTDNQKERLQDILAKDIEIQTKKKMKSFYDNSVKGKKFKSMKELKELFKKEYDETTYKH